MDGEGLSALDDEVLGDGHDERLVRRVATGPDQPRTHGQGGDGPADRDQGTVAQHLEGVLGRIGHGVGNVGGQPIGGRAAEDDGVAVSQPMVIEGQGGAADARHRLALAAGDGGVVAAGGGGGVGSAVEGTDQAVSAPGATGGDGDAAVGLAHKVGGLGEGHRAVVVHDGDGGADDARQGAPGQAGELEGEGLVALDQGVGGDRHGEALDDLAVGEGQGVGRPGVIAAVQRRPVGRVVLDRHRPGAAGAALHVDRQAARLLVDRVGGKLKAQGARRALVVQDRQRGVGVHRAAHAQSHALVVGRGQRGRGAAHHLGPGVEEGQGDRLVALGERVLNDRDGEGQVGDAAGERERIVHAGVVADHGGLAEARLRHGRVVHLHGAGHAAQAGHGDAGGAAALADGVARLRKADHAVVVLDGQGGADRRAQGAGARRAQGDHGRAVGLDGGVVGQQVDGEVAADLAGGEGDARRGRQAGDVASAATHAVADHRAVVQTSAAHDRQPNAARALGGRVGRTAEGERAAIGVEAAVQAHEATGDRPVEAGEGAGGDQAAVGLHAQRVDLGVGTGAEVDGGIQGAVVVEADQAGAALPIDRAERTRHHNLAVAHQQPGHEVVRALAHSTEEGLQRAPAVEPRQPVAPGAAHAREVAADEQFAIAGQGQGAHGAVDCGGRDEARVQRAAGQEEAGHLATRGAVEAAEVAGHIEIPAGGHRDGGLVHQHRTHLGVGPGEAVHEPGVQGAVSVQPGDAAAGHAIDTRERTDQQHLAVTLHGHCVHRVVGARQAVLEGDVQGAVGVQPGDAAAQRGARVGEGAADDDLAHVGAQEAVGVAVHGDAVDDGAHRQQGGRGEGEVQRAVHVEAGHAATGHPVDVGEEAPDDQLARRVQRHRVDRGVDPSALIEGAVRRAGVEPHQEVVAAAADPVVAGEGAAHDVVGGRAHRLQAQGVDRAVKGGAKAQGAVHRTRAGQLGDPVVHLISPRGAAGGGAG